MAFDFNADEIYEMAQQIERNGAAFYRKAAEAVDEAPAKKSFCSILPRWKLPMRECLPN